MNNQQQHTGDSLIDGCRYRVEQEARKSSFQTDPIRVEFWAMYEHSKGLLAEIKELKAKNENLRNSVCDLISKPKEMTETQKDAEDAFSYIVNNGGFARIARTPNEQGYHYGPIKEKYPNMPEPQVKRACSLLDAGWSWLGYSQNEIVLGCQIYHDTYEHKSVGVDGNPVMPSIESRMKEFK